ncbi:MAG: hypothetical protein GC190_21160 [Alphaproteobacteria bacterium]|nr:hypothetical protein [Alphaproteobacteria bacterium]
MLSKKPVPPVLELGARDEARYVLAHCRARDRAEIEATADFDAAAASILDMLPLAAASNIFRCNGVPAALTMFHEMTPAALTVSMIATDEWPSVAIDAMRWGLRRAKPHLIARGYRRAECRAIDGPQGRDRFPPLPGFRGRGAHPRVRPQRRDLHPARLAAFRSHLSNLSRLNGR